MLGRIEPDYGSMPIVAGYAARCRALIAEIRAEQETGLGVVDIIALDPTAAA